MGSADGVSAYRFFAGVWTLITASKIKKNLSHIPATMWWK